MNVSVVSLGLILGLSLPGRPLPRAVADISASLQGEHVTIATYSNAVPKSGWALLVFYSSSHDCFDLQPTGESNALTANAHAMRFMRWASEVYGGRIASYLFVELPVCDAEIPTTSRPPLCNELRSRVAQPGPTGRCVTQGSFDVLKKETGLDTEGRVAMPSFALYYNGKLRARIRGGPKDVDIETGYRRLQSVLERAGLSMAQQ